jgi:hypothetical protein
MSVDPRIDFVPVRRPKTGAWLALAAAVLVWAGLGLKWQADGRVLEARRAQVEQLEATQAEAVRRAAPATRLEPLAAAERAALRGAADELALPWADLLERAARSAGPGLVLLAFEPDPTRDALTLTVESADRAAMLRYLRALNRPGGLGPAVLRDFEPGSQTGWLRFSVEASLAGVRGEGRR